MADAAAIWRLVNDSGVLDPNSAYLYLLLCRDFAATCVVAESSDGLAGFVTAYRPPADPEVIFVWQVGVAAAARRKGLALRMLRSLVSLPACRDAKFLEATVAPTNVASRQLFERLAAELEAPLQFGAGFTRHQFPADGHEEEPRLRIGPLQRMETIP